MGQSSYTGTLAPEVWDANGTQLSETDDLRRLINLPDDADFLGYLIYNGESEEFLYKEASTFDKPHAVEAANTIGVPPQFLVAHSALESAWGKSEIHTTDGAPSCNLFGVKAGRTWQGPSVEVQTTEYVDGVAQVSRERFRVYGSYDEAFSDYASRLRNTSRFSGVLGQQDGAQFARSLQQSGYATDPMYADKLSRIINGTTLRQALSG